MEFAIVNRIIELMITRDKCDSWCKVWMSVARDKLRLILQILCEL